MKWRWPSVIGYIKRRIYRLSLSDEMLRSSSEHIVRRKLDAAPACRSSHARAFYLVTRLVTTGEQGTRLR